MQQWVINQNWFLWSLLLIVGFPLLMFLLGEIIVRLERRRKRITAPLRILRNLVLPSLALFILVSTVLPLPQDAIVIRIAETLLWIAVIYGALSFINVALFEEAEEESWRSNVPKLFLDLSRFFLVLVGTAIVFSTVWGADLGGLLTALGVGSLVIGLALQDSLGNIFSGVTLLFERPLAIGDWVEINNTVGKVVEMTWRSVHLQTGLQDLIIVPNSELAKGSFRNLSQPTRLHVETVDVSFSYDDPPNVVRQVLKQAALETEGVLHDPAPWVVITSYADYYIGYKVGISGKDFEQAAASRGELLIRIWYAAKRHNLTIPFPTQTEYQYQVTASAPEDQHQKILNALQALPSLSALDLEDLQKWSEKITTKHYARSETIISEGEQLPGLYLILSGRVELSVGDHLNKKQIISHLSKGEFFGERASLLSNQESVVTVMALDDLEVLILDTDILQILLIRTPLLAAELGEVMEIRRKAIYSACNAA